MMVAVLASIPPPPLGRTADHPAELLMLWIGFAIAGALIIYGVQQYVRHRSPVLILCLIGAGLASSLEILMDKMVLVYEYEKGAVIAFHISGRGLPLYIVLMYVVFVGGQTYLFYRLVQSGPTERQYLIALAAIGAFDALMELPATRLGLYAYYGPQSFSPWGFPLVYCVLNLGGLVPAVIFVRIPRLLEGWGCILAVLAVPSGFFAWELGVGWPYFVSLNTDLGRWATYPGAVLSVVIGCSIIVMVRSLICGSSAPAMDRDELASDAIPSA